MIGGYARLSRDEDGKNYSSIENQIQLLEEAAKENGHIIDKWYIDDGISGYVFDRPSFNELNDDLQKCLDVLYVKDFSRIGRHNAKVLLFIEQFPVIKKRLIVVNENYDSDKPGDDDIVGIKTWFNERYVKDTSKKIKKVYGFKQKNNLLPYKKHFCYEFANMSKTELVVVSQEEKICQLIKNLYIGGFGYRNISQYLNERNIKTPSQYMHERDVQKGDPYPTKILATKWSSDMVKEILCDDFYIGTRRTHVREKKVIHGTDLRVPKEEQYVFENAHPKIWDKQEFDLICKLRKERQVGNYKGTKKKDSFVNKFPNLIYCKQCGHLYTPIIRKRGNGSTHVSYACSYYNRLGRAFCDSHYVPEEKLMSHIYTFMKAISDCLDKYLTNLNLIDFKTEEKNITNDKFLIQAQLDKCNSKLKELFSQKLVDLSQVDNEISKKAINESYSLLQNEILEQINNLSKKLNAFDDVIDNIERDSKTVLTNAKEYVDYLIEEQKLDTLDFVKLFERIEIDAAGCIDFKLRHNLDDAIRDELEYRLNYNNNKMFLETIKLLKKDKFLSINTLGKHLDSHNLHITKKQIISLLNILIVLGYIYKTEEYHKPYQTMKKDKELNDIIHNFEKMLCRKNDVSYNGVVLLYNWANQYNL